MAGGTWIDQNKVRPGVYIDYKSAPASLVVMGERGTVAIARVLSWGEVGAFTTIEAPQDTISLGYDSTDSSMLFIRQILLGTNRSNGANKILVWRLATTGSAAATVTLGNLVATAKYVGVRGNSLSVAVTIDPDYNSVESGYKVYVQTLLEAQVVDNQTIFNATAMPVVSDVSNNDYITFSGTGALSASAATALVGGLDGTAASSAYSAFQTALETTPFDVVIYDGSDAVLKSSFALFVKRLSNSEGIRCQCVLSDYASADSECVISCYPQSISLASGESLDQYGVTWWVGGASSGANVNQSLTYSMHPDAVTISPKLTGSQQEEAINNGQFTFIEQYGNVQVLTDINTFTTFSVDKGKAFRKNRVIRTVFGLCNDIYKIFSKYYIGAVHNDEEGRKALKAEILSLMLKYQGNRALQNVLVDDVTVSRGVESDAVVIEINCQPVDSIEKIYINITIS